MLILHQTIRLSSVSCIKDLGVFIDCDLSFSKHIDDITRRAYQRTYMIYKSFDSRNKIMLSKAYTTRAGLSIRLTRLKPRGPWL